MRVEQGRGRKTRSDKKKEVKPTLSIELKDAIYRLSHVTFTPVKDVCEKLCNTLATDRDTIEKLSSMFQHDLFFDDALYRGDLYNEQINKRIVGATSTVTIKFHALDYDTIYKLAFALSVSPSRVVAVLLELAMSDIDVVNQYIKDYLQGEISERQMNDLKELLSYLNRTNPNHHSWASLMGQIHEEHGSAMMRIKEIVANFLRKQ